jgi:hypothetical protein
MDKQFGSIINIQQDYNMKSFVTSPIMEMVLQSRVLFRRYIWQSLIVTGEEECR